MLKWDILNYLKKWYINLHGTVGKRVSEKGYSLFYLLRM